MRQIITLSRNKAASVVRWTTRTSGDSEFGNVYESLLEQHLKLNLDAATFELDIRVGNERKTTGNHYTPARVEHRKSTYGAFRCDLSSFRIPKSGSWKN